MANAIVNLVLVFLSVMLGYYLAGLSIKSGSKKKPEDRAKKTFLPQMTESPLERKIMAEESILVIEEISKNISLSSDLNSLASGIVKTTCKILNTEICALLMLNKDTDTLNVIASVGIENEFANTIRIKRGTEISGLAAKFNETIVINDWDKGSLSYKLKYDACYKNSLISTVLSMKDKIIGVLNISSHKTGKPFSAIDMGIVKIIAAESAVALQNFQLLQEQQDNYLNTIITLASAIDARDPYTYRHSQDVAKYSLRIAQELRLPMELIHNIRQAALLHDIGKIAIPDAILQKTGELTDEEYAKIKIHSGKGEEIVKSLPFLQETAKIMRHHHERFDGKGYPDGIKGTDIEIGARILAVADSFDAMTTNRLYRAALTLEDAKKELIKNKNTQFDPNIVDCLLEILEKDPGFFNN